MRYIVLPVDMQWGIWDTLNHNWAWYLDLSPEDLTYKTIAEATETANRMNQEVDR